MKEIDRELPKEGALFLITSGVLTILFLTLSYVWFFFHFIGWIFFIATAFLVYFFRNPSRKVPDEKNIIVSPADGKIIEVEEGIETRFMKGDVKKVSIFMSLFDVHINRIPIDGIIVDTEYVKGEFFRADSDKASKMNERNVIMIEDAKGRRVIMIQIAGVFARRIVSYAEKGDSVVHGQRFGMIMFGSRVELLLPTDVHLMVRKGDRVRGGETIIGRFEWI